jgi:hypothetical protein
VSDLFTPDAKESVLKKRFVGVRISIETILGATIEIVDFEINKSQRTGHELLYLQLKVCTQPRMCWTEGCLLISTIKAANRVDLPFKTKIIKDSKGYLKFAKSD